MPKKNRNRDILNEQCMYDLLCKMNMRAMPNVCVIQMLNKTGIRDRCERYTDRAVTHADCEKCIADWLNEFPF